MKSILVLFFYILLLCIPEGVWGRAAYLFNNGKSEYNIFVSKEASVSEKTASKELQYYLKKVGDVNLPIVSNVIARNHYIFIGSLPSSIKDRALESKKYDDDDDSFSYYSKNGDIYIIGGRNRGTMYGVFSFLENELGVRWYTKSYTKTPKLIRYSFDALNHKESELIKHRQIEYYGFSTDTALYVHNKMNQLWESMPNKYGTIPPYYCVHTSFLFVSPNKYFKSHPEYFSLHDGKRINNGQLCLSNPHVLEVVKDYIRDHAINDQIGYWCYDVSQNDNQLFCECKNCRKLEKKYGGGHAGIWIWFVNQVADAFPKYKFGTLAYQYTRHAPQNIVPRSNVVVRLCSYENCFSHPIETCSRNAAFLKDLSDWSKLTKNIYIWDYVVDFNQYLLPWPDFRVLASNIRTFIKYGALSLMELGQYQGPGGEFSEMRPWIISKLMWNPYLNVDSLAHEFISDYYGKASAYIYDYYLLTQNLVRSDTHITLMERASSSLYTDDYIKQAKSLIQQASKSVKGDSVMKARVDLVSLQVYYLETMRNRSTAVMNGNLMKTMNLLEKYKPRINEGITADDFIRKSGYI